MKITKLAIIFSLLFYSFCLPFTLEGQEATAVVEMLIRYDNALNNAVEDAVDSMVELDSRSEIVVNKDLALEAFFRSLYANLGAHGNAHVKESMKAYVPVILVTDQDGYYIYHSAIIECSGGKEAVWEWTEKRPYSREIGGNVYRFTLGDYLTYYDGASGETMEGYYQEVSEAFPDNAILADGARYDAERRFCIIDAIREDLKLFVNGHNRIAKTYGITYQFSLPYIEREDWYRTVDDVSFFAVFQGYPYESSGKLGTFNKYAFAGARVRKSDWFYLTEKGGRREYHKSGCRKVALYGTGEIYYTKKECAKSYAYPCRECNP